MVMNNIHRGNKINTNSLLSQSDIQVMSEMVARASLAAKLGIQSYGGARDLYEALGYKTSLVFDDFLARYERQDIAKAIIDRPVNATWKGCLEIQEVDDDKETALELAWKDLDDKYGIKAKLSRVDKLSGIGCYGILLLGLNDVRTKEDFIKPVVGFKKLMYIKPFSEGSAPISKYDEDPNSPRYGLPLIYSITINSESGTTTVSSNTTSTITIDVHFSRVIHIVDDVLESEVLGAPRLEIVFNRLMDIEKIVGGDAEMFWRGARPGYSGDVDPSYQMTQTTQNDLKNQLDEYEHNLRRFLVMEGVKINPLATQVVDPTSHVDIQIQMISAAKGIPKRILVGSERGELSSGQDSDEWKEYITSRREEHAEPHIVRPFVNRCIELGILPKPKSGKYQVKWQDLFAMSEADRVKIGKDRATAIKEYTSSPADSVMPPKAFLEFCLGLTTDQITLIEQMIAEQVNTESQAMQNQPDDDLNNEESLTQEEQAQLND